MKANSWRHELGTAEGGTHQSTDRKRWSEGDSPSRDGRRKEGMPNVRTLEIIEASQGIVDETRGCSVNEVGAPGVLKNLLEGAFHCGCR